jgi:protein-serine/threonine kinase
MSGEMLDEPERTRSISQYVPEALAIPKPRPVAVSGSGPDTPSTVLQREEFLGERRGIASPLAQAPPILPQMGLEPTHEEEPAPKRPKLEIFTANSISTGQIRRYESIRLLGQGTFSRVYLAVRQVRERADTVDYSKDSVNMAGVRARSRRLVAIKVVEHGPAGGADAERIEISLKREVEILRAIKHPSVVHLKAFGNDPSARALLVMNYCPGGDLFDVASTKLEILTPGLVRRIFSELVSAVRYLHQKYIVHRDIKLESRSNLLRVDSANPCRRSSQHTDSGAL